MPCRNLLWTLTVATMVSSCVAFQSHHPLTSPAILPTSSCAQSVLRYANTAHPPPTSSVVGKSFEERLRKRILEHQSKKLQSAPTATTSSQLQPTTKVLQRKPHVFGRRPSFLREISTLPEYKKHVAQERDRITVVRFYAPSCRACKAATPAFDQLANKYSDTLNWIEVPVSKENKALHQGLGVPSVPFGHIYSPTVGMVEELRMVRPQMFKFANILDSYVQGYCDLPDDVNENGIFASPYDGATAATP